MKATRRVAERVQRKFDPAFKAQALQNWMEINKSAEVIGRELGIDPNRLYAWRKQFAPKIAATSKPPSITDLQARQVSSHASARQRAAGNRGGRSLRFQSARPVAAVVEIGVRHHSQNNKEGILNDPGQATANHEERWCGCHRHPWAARSTAGVSPATRRAATNSILTLGRTIMASTTSAS